MWRRESDQRRGLGPCQRHDCHACCEDTRMSLRLADVARIERAGHRDFYSRDEDGYLRLKNVDGHCVFLVDGSCSIYPHRPEGCVLYPLILYTDCDEVGLHHFCPHRHEFSFTSGDEAWLRRGIATEDEEARRRLRETVGGSDSD